MLNTISNYRNQSFLQNRTSSNTTFKGKQENIEVSYWNYNKAKPDTSLMLRVREMIKNIQELFLNDKQMDNSNLIIRIGCEKAINAKPSPEIGVYITEEGILKSEIHGTIPEQITQDFVEKGLVSKDPLVGLTTETR